jgi:hypothetical protein
MDHPDAYQSPKAILPLVDQPANLEQGPWDWQFFQAVPQQA